MRATALLLYALALNWNGARAAEQSAVLYNIATQPLGPALHQFARRSDLYVMFSPQAVQDLRSPGLKGVHSREGALQALLAGTRLEFVFADARTVIVRRRPEGPIETSPQRPTAENETDVNFSQHETIVVTARKREERLQDIPLAISAFSQEQIQEAGFRDLGDLALQTPGMSFNPRSGGVRAGRVDSRIRLRGVTSDSHLDHLQPTSLFIDGIFVLGTANSIGLQDLERVEVIKGPQSAFFGRNTFAGAINFITRNPDLYEFRTELDMSAASYEKYDVSALHSGPLIPGKLAYQVNTRAYRRGSEWTATDGGELGVEASNFFSGVLYAEPIENLSMKFRAYFQRDDDGPPAAGMIRSRDIDTCSGKTFTRLDAVGNPLTIQPRNFICGYVPQRGEPGAPVISRETSLFPAIMFRDRNGTSPSGPLLGPQPYVLINELLVKADEFIGVDVPDLDGFGMKRDQIRLSLNTDYELASGYSASVLAGWNDTRMNTMGDHDFSDTQSWYSSDPKFGRDWSVEARISSPQNRRLRGMIGATYYDQEFVTSGSGGLTVSACSNTSCLAGPLVTSTPPNNGNVAEVMGVFGSVSFDILNNLTLDIEGGYAEDKRSVIQTGASFSSTFKQTTPRVILTYKPADETTLYAQVSRGALPGVTNGLVSTCSDQAFTVPYTNPLTGQLSTASECAQISAQLTADQYKGATDSQELDAYEIGWKQTLFDRRLSFNVNAWYYEWKNRPYNLSISWVRDADDPANRDGMPNEFTNSLGVTAAGGQRLWGSEFESALAVTPRWNLQVNASWSDNAFTTYYDRILQAQFGFTNLRGLQVPRNPNWQGALVSAYQSPLARTNWEWYARADLAYTGEYWADAANLARARDYTLVNARLGIRRHRTRVELFVRNLLQQERWQTVDDKTDFTVQGIIGGWPRGIAVVPQEKQTFGWRAIVQF